MRARIIKIGILCLIVFLIIFSKSYDCPETRLLDDPVTLELNMQYCRSASMFSSRGMNIRWTGSLRRARAGATGGEERFEEGYVICEVLPESPSGRSWFRHPRTPDNLKPGDWDIHVEMVLPGGAGLGIRHYRVDIVGSRTNLYITYGNSEVSKISFPDCEG